MGKPLSVSEAAAVYGTAVADLHQPIILQEEGRPLAVIVTFDGAMVKQSDGWWIGWLLDLPGVNAQERTREELMESLRIGAEDMLATQVSFEPDGVMTIVGVPDPEWLVNAALA